MSRIAGVYGICCKKTGRWYVGASVDIERRIKNHYYELRIFGARGDKGQMGLDFSKYGRNAFYDVIFEKVDNVNQLADRERAWAEKTNAITDGYNSQAPGINRYWSG
jgi:group I intron endonuclease